MNLETKNLPKKACFPRKPDRNIFGAKRSSKEHSGDAKGYRETQIRSNFPGNQSRSKLSQSAKTIGKMLHNLKSTLARPPIYDRTYPDKLSAAPSGNPVGVTKPSSFPLFVQPNKSSLEQFDKGKPDFRQFSAINPGEKFARTQNLHRNTPLYSLLVLLLNSKDMHQFEAR